MFQIFHKVFGLMGPFVHIQIPIYIFIRSNNRTVQPFSLNFFPT
uniref:ORF43p n=1 Tax=Pinus koraiensis TaxID=88728 RepID=A4QMG9_PINKO|nr:ORF43p [Pinus koraiensis]